ncbi:MAG: DUF87 domain-containing protein, partial [Candidatus Thermoplasmatota archaeon]
MKNSEKSGKLSRLKDLFKKEYVRKLNKNSRNQKLTTKEGQTYRLLPYDEEELSTTPVEFLKRMRSLGSYYSVEYYKEQSGITIIRHWTDEAKNAVKKDILPSNFQYSKIKSNNSFMHLKKYISGSITEVSEPYFLPILVYDTNKFMRSKRIFSTLAALEGEYLFQILMHPAPKDCWHKRFFRDNLNPLKSSYQKLKRKFKNREDEVGETVAQGMEWKVDSIFPIQTQIRILGTSNEKHPLQRGFEDLKRTMSIFSHPTKLGSEISLKRLKSKKLEKLLERMKKREWYYTSLFANLKEGWRQKRPTFTTKELANFVSIPDRPSEHNIISNQVKPRTLSPALKKDMKGLKDYTIVGEDDNENPIPIFDFNKHVHISGRTGMGKSTVMENIILDKIEDDKNVIVFDPHHSLTEGVLQKMPENKLEDVIYIGPKSPLGINALSPPGFPDRLKFSELDEEEKRNIESAKQNTIEKTTTSLLNMFKESFGEQFFGPQNEEIFEFFTSALLKEKGANFVDFYHLLTNKDSAQRFAEISTEEIETFVTNTYQSLRPEQTQSTINKIGKIYRSRTLIEQLCRREPSVKIVDLFEPG